MDVLAIFCVMLAAVLVLLHAVAVRHPRVHLAWLGMVFFIVAVTIWHVVGNLDPIFKG